MAVEPPKITEFLREHPHVWHWKACAVPLHPKGEGWVYVFWGEGKSPLYVGSSSEVVTRIGKHVADKDWWADVRRVEVWGFADHDAAHRMEQVIIYWTEPVYNKWVTWAWWWEGGSKEERQRERWANDPEFRERENKRQRERYANDPEYREKRNKRIRERKRELYADPEKREQKNKRERERRANDPEFRERRNKRERERNANDPEYREKRNKQRREWEYRQRNANDPEYREKRNKQNREYRERKRRKRRGES